MDTTSMIDQLVALESRPLDLLAQRQSAYKAQVSALGEIASKLGALQTAARALGEGGVIATTAASETVGFSAVPGSGAAAGRYSVTVHALARAAKWRSAAFAAADRFAGGTLNLRVQGVDLPAITIPDGATLADVADAIRRSGAPVSAVVLNDGESSYLSITARDTGHPLSGTPADALAITFTPDEEATGKLPAFAQTQAAANAVVEVDGLVFTRQSNTISDAIPGTTLTLKAAGGAAEDLVLATDGAATKANLQKFVDAYNDVMKLVQKHLAPAEGTDRSRTLAGDFTIRSLQGRLQALVTTVVPGLGNVRTLADVGVKTARDGSISIDATTFDRVLAKDPAALDGLFAAATDGLAAEVKALVQAQTRAGDGALTLRQKSLGETIARLDLEKEQLERRIESFRTNLIRQFTAMEETVSRLKGIGDFLAAQEKASSGRD